jgi:hypothetical protein
VIKILFKIDEGKILSKGRNEAFNEALNEWEILPWVKYLREHGKLVHVDDYKEFITYSHTYQLMFELDPKQETFFYLKYGNEYNNIKRLT